jgi:hypothetical protein
MAFQDIRKSRKFLSATDIGFVLGVLILLGALLALNIYLARTLDGGEWLFLRWNGVRALMFEKLEPYGSTIAERVQLLVYGREAFLSEYPYALNDPFYIVLLYAPLAWFFSDFSIAHGVWMLLSQVALVAIVLLSLNLSEWKPPAWMVVALIGFGLFSYFSIDSFLSGSPAIFLTLLYLCILVALRSFSDELAGVLLCLVAYQWELGTLFFLFVLIFVFANRRWSVLAGFGMALLVLLIISLISNSGWVVSYIRAMLFDWNRGVDQSFGTTLAYLFPSLSFPVGRWIAVIVGMVLLFESIRSVNEHFRHVAWATFLALAANPMLGFAIFPSNHVVFIPAFVLVVALAWERWMKNRMLVSISLLAIVFLFFFGLYYYQGLFAEMSLYSDLLKILPPVLTTLGLYWMRWWAVRPPRIWADQFGARK